MPGWKPQIIVCEVPFGSRRRSPAVSAAGLVGLISILGIQAGCAGPKRASGPVGEIWVVGPSEPVERPQPVTEETPIFSKTRGRIYLQGGLGETVAFELIVSAPGTAISGVKLEAEDLQGPMTLSGQSIRLYRHWPVAIERYPNWYLRSIGVGEPRRVPDALVPVTAPIQGQPYTVLPGDPLRIWVEVQIPQDAKPGRYESAIVITDAGGNKTRSVMELNIRDIYLPPKYGIPVLARVQLEPVLSAHTKLDPANLREAINDPEARRVLTRTFAILHDHGLSPFTTDVRPLFEQSIDGGVSLTWTDYDAFCGPLIDGQAYDDGRPADAWPLPVNLEQPNPVQFDGIQSPQFATVLRECVAKAAAHFDEKKWLDRSFVWYEVPKSADPTPAELGDFKKLAVLTQAGRADLRIVSNLIPQPMAPFGWHGHHFEDLSGLVSIWATPARYQHPPTLTHLRTNGKQTWLPPDRPPFAGSITVEAPPLQARSLLWQAYLHHHNAILLPTTTRWPERPFEEAIDAIALPSDEWLLYPGTFFGLEEPIASVRLKQLKLGLQDYQRLRVLDEQGRAGTAQLLSASLIKAAGTDAYGDNYQDGLFGRRIEDPKVWALGESILMEETLGAVSPEAEKNLDRTTLQASWANLLSATRSIQVRAESARLTLLQEKATPGAGGGAPRTVKNYQITYEISVRSELRTPLEGVLQFGAMPALARIIGEPVTVGPLTEMAIARYPLTCTLPHFPPCDLDGHAVQKVVFDAAATGLVETDAVLAAVQVPLSPRAIQIDGNLGEWVPHEFNVAGDFRLINDHLDPRTHHARATSQTVAYFCRDAGRLCIAMHAASPPEAAAPPQRLVNEVQYEDLMPVGEDLIEILIDPTNAGTQSDDLFHIVLKSTGIAQFERGIGLSPPIGRREPWPGEPPLYAVTRTTEGWSIEIAIPTTAFGEASRNRVWGMNIARLEPIRGEYSDWARAPRYCYDPRTLGNLIWPD